MASPDLNSIAQWLMANMGSRGLFQNGYATQWANVQNNPGLFAAVQSGDPSQVAQWLQQNPNIANQISADTNYSAWNLTQQQTGQLQQNQANQQQILQNVQQFASQLQKPLDPNDPLYKSILSSAANAGGGAAEAQGINGPLGAANVSAATAGALANTELQRQGLAAQLLGQGGNLALGGGQLGLQGYEAGQQTQYNNAAIQSANNPLNSIVAPLAGRALGGLTGAATGQLAGGLGIGTNALTAPGGVPSTPIAPQGIGWAGGNQGPSSGGSFA